MNELMNLMHVFGILVVLWLGLEEGILECLIASLAWCNHWIISDICLYLYGIRSVAVGTASKKVLKAFQ